MNRNQRWSLWIGIAVVVIMGMYPPWYQNVGGVIFHHGYHLIFNPPANCGIDLTRLLVQWIMVVAISGAAILTFGGMQEVGAKDDRGVKRSKKAAAKAKGSKHQDSENKGRTGATESAGQELPLKWFKFVTYVQIPLGILLSLVYVVAFSGQLSLVLPLLYLIVLGFLLYGFHKRRKWSLRLYIVLLLVNSFIYPIRMISDVGLYFLAVILVNLFYTLPNHKYFNKREGLFS